MTDTAASTALARRSSIFRLWPWALLALASLGVGLYIRYGLIQSTPIGLSCQDAGAPWFCAPRDWVIQFNMIWGWSYAALLGGALALAKRWRWAIALGLAAGAAGLVLYNAGPAGAGFILSLSALLRR
jgi:hypothetical protein